MSAELQTADKLVGQILAERYQILHRLGEGAMGVVYKARHVKVGRLFAVKVLHPRTLIDPKVAQRFAREAELAGRLRHPNVVGVVDVGEIEGTRYMVMDFAEGPDLAKLLDEAPMPPDRIIRLVRQMLEGLYHAHEQGLIHRDFKPENVIVERNAHGDETPRIVDFGIALLREGSGSVDNKGRLTTNGLVLGTPHYMAPEQAVADPIDHRIDLFALGIVIYEMLSGRLPFDGSGAEVARANLLLDPPLIKQRVPHLEVDPLLEAFARRLMAKRRESRPATARVAREILDLIETDRARAAGILGVPIARSGRLPAATEPVGAEASAGPTQPSGDATVPMKPTPRPAPPVVVAGPSMPGPAAVLAPGAAMPAAGAEPAVALAEAPVAVASAPSTVVPVYLPASGLPPGTVVYPPHPLARPPDGSYSPPRGSRSSHRDTALRTPLGWQTASLPGRRRSWLIGGAAIGTACVLTAAILSFRATRDDRSAGPAPVASAAATPSPPSGAPRVDPTGARETREPTAAPAITKEPVAAAATGTARNDAISGGARPAATDAGDGTRSAINDERRRVAPDAPREPRQPGGTTRSIGSRSDGSPAGGSRASRAATKAASGAPIAGDTSRTGPSTREPPARSSPPAPAPGSSDSPREPPSRETPREPHAREVPERDAPSRDSSGASHEAKPARSDPGRATTSRQPTGVSPTALQALHDTVWRELWQLPQDKRGDLTSQMLLFKINDEMQADEPQRNRTAGQMLQILEEIRRRMAQ